jgi:DNA-binding NarL/FixJ family response regulator
MAEQLRVLLVDDHAIVRAGCRRLLDPTGRFEVLEAASGTEALAMCAGHAPDVMVLDLSMPDLGGLEVLRRLRATRSKTAVLVFSVHDEAIFAVRSLEAGAQGYITKGDSPTDLLTAIDTVSRGEVYLSHDIAHEVAVMSLSKKKDPFADLTARELEMLRLFAKGATLNEMADALGVSYKTVANTSVKLRSRLGAKSTSELVRIALEQGLLS